MLTFEYADTKYTDISKTKTPFPQIVLESFLKN